MKISPVATPANTTGAMSAADPAPTMAQKVRSLRMSTNATPGRAEPAPAPAPAAADPLTIPDTLDPATADLEATQPLSPQFAALAKQRRALQVKEREIADREKALGAAAPVQGDVVTKAQLKSDPLSTLLDAGVTYDQLTAAILASQDGTGPEIQALKDEIKALKDGVETKFKDKEAQAEQQVLAEMRKEATLLIAEGDAFEMVRETKSIDDVISLIERTYRKTGEVLDVQEALQLIEDELLQDVLKVARINKVQSQIAPSAPPPPQQRPGMRTLTNRDTASVPMSAKQRALAAFHGTLKQR